MPNEHVAPDQIAGAMTPPIDLHEHLARLEAAGLLVRVDRPINKDRELQPLVRLQFLGGMPENERKNTAYHESGHAVVAKLLLKTDPVHKVTIIPRGRALGVTMQLPQEDRYSMDREHILQNISVLFGGRIAEEIFMGQMTTGASNDFERATDMARRMVTQWGMSDELGPMIYGENEGEIFLGRSITTHKNLSEATMQKVDSAIRKIIDERYGIARKLIEDNRDKVEAMTKALLEWETIDSDQINDIMAGKPPRPPKPTAPPTSPDSPPSSTPTPAPTAAPAQET